MRRFTVAVLAVFLVAAACSSDVVVAERAIGDPTVVPEAVTDTPPTAVPTEIPTVPPTVDPTSTPEAPTSPPAPTVTPAPTATPQPDGPCGVGPLALPNPDRPIYDASLTIDPLARSVVGSMTIDFGPDLPVDELILRLWPNGPRSAAGGADLTLTSVSLPSGPVEPELLTPTLVRIPLANTLQPGERIEVELDFELVVPIELRSRLSGRDDYMRLGTILPILPWEPGIGWATDPATSLFAEAVLSPVADWSVAIDAPDDYMVLASGVDDGTGRWNVESARDFAISVGRFRTVEAIAMAPEPVVVTVGVHETIDDDPQAYLNKVVDSLEQFSERFGQYPWPSLTFAVTPNLRGGIEFPTHIMQGQNTIGRTTSHEVGHMFFYSLVGNNQGADPWLDEGITSYAEFTYEGTAPDSYLIAAEGVGQATRPMTFWEGRGNAYYSSVYSQTGFALQRLGSREDVDCALARFVAANAHAIARPADFVAAFEPTFPDVVAQMADLGVAIDS
jgi:hypothetical protein